MKNKANTVGFATEAEARAHAREWFALIKVNIIHSPNDGNSTDCQGKRRDYYVESTSGNFTSGFIRSWESIVYSGKGGKA